MKYFKLITILFLIFGGLSAKADYTTTNTFVVNAQNTITVITSGNLTSSINGFDGYMTAPLSINFNITTNEDVNDIRLKALVKDGSSTNHSAFYCTESSAVTNQNMYVILAELDPDEVTIAGILDCKQPSSTPVNNPCLIAYPGTITINNNGTIQYMDNSGEGYFSAIIKTGTTDLNMTLGTSVKPGTYDINTACDCADTYEVEVFLDNIPG